MTDIPSGSAEQAGSTPPEENEAKNIIDFDAERCRRIMVEAQRLADLAPGEWRIWIDRSAENLGVAREALEDLTTDIIKTEEKKARAKAAEDRLIEQLAKRESAKGQARREGSRTQKPRQAESVCDDPEVAGGRT